MALLPIIIAPDPLLKQVSKPVEKVDAELCTFMDSMLETMYNAHGIGLAAVQVGVLKRIIVVDVDHRDDGKPNNPLKLINPEIISHSDDEQPYKEGCLSFPKQYSEVVRPTEVTVRYLDEHGKQQELKASGLLATCIQHEIDHTNGIVFVDHISKLKRDMIVKKLQKQKKAGELDHIYDPDYHDHDHDEHVHYHDGVACRGHHH